jgi:uncharacterized RDD family membrane protein YckC
VVMKHTIWGICLCALLITSCTPDAQIRQQITPTLVNNDTITPPMDSPVLLAGAGDQGWLILRNDDRFDILSYSASGQWRWAGRNIVGHVTAACGDSQGRLLAWTHSPNALLLFAETDQTPQVGPAIPDAIWPADARAVAACVRPSQQGTGGARLVLIASPHADGTPGELTLLSLTGNTWQDLGSMDAPGGDPIHYALVTDNGHVYLQVTTSEGGWLYEARLTDSVAWTRHTVSPATTLLTLNGDAYRLALTPAGDQWSLTLGTLNANRPSALPTRAITLDGAPLLLPSVPQVSTVGSQIALMWYDGQTARYTFCDAYGVAEPLRDLLELDAPPPDTRGEVLYRYFFFGILGLTLFAMFAIPPKAPLGPVMLPVIYKPAPLIKRLLASVIDIVIVSIPFAIYLQKHIAVDPVVTDWKSMLTFQAVYNQFLASYDGALAAITTLGAFLAYCVVMEMRFAGTLGKLIFGLKTVSSNGLPLGWREVIVRNTFKVFSLALVPYLPILIMALNPARQRLGDMFGRSIVVAPTGVKLPENVSLEELYESLRTGQQPGQQDDQSDEPDN